MESKVVQLGPHWNYERARRLFVFGDSYSSIGISGLIHSGSAPTSTHPLGAQIEFPGVTWNEAGLPNWVGHFLTRVCPTPRFPWPESSADYDQKFAFWKTDPILVYNYAVGGHTTVGVRNRVERAFLSDVGKKPEWVEWTADNSLFVFEVGINDCAHSTSHEDDWSILESLHEQLYDAGARNFLFMDVPPVELSPAMRSSFGERAKASITNWNKCLHQSAQKLAAAHPETTVLIFSLHKLFSALLHDPEAYGFPVEDRKRAMGQIWVDHIHPSSRVHEIIASGFADFLSDVRQASELPSNQPATIV
ncbi:SGNH hydrolase-type esterase domain-containing protein [Flagelloscypha sp. PMI_526]|nr:SGNH hydrolase-type esterase domain-containing protein [Flagelloscypha sp. PMI_526]